MKGVVSIGSYDLPSFCFQCGSPFPWTTRRQQTAIDLFSDEVNNADDCQLFEESIRQVLCDTPQAQLASNRVVRLLAKVGKGTAQAIRDVLVDVVSEAAKKAIFPGTK